jgi:hypothetical protein
MLVGASSTKDENGVHRFAVWARRILVPRARPKAEAGDTWTALGAGSEGTINGSPGLPGLTRGKISKHRSPTCWESKGGRSLMCVAYERRCGSGVSKKSAPANEHLSIGTCSCNTSAFGVFEAQTLDG